MKNFKQTEKLMTLPERRKNPAYANAFEQMRIALKFYDVHFCTCHCEALNALYGEKKRSRTYDGIALDLGMSDNALRRHRKLYADMFEYYLEIEKSDRAKAV